MRLLSVSISFIISGLLILSLIAQERLVPTTPEVKTTSEYRIAAFRMDLDNPITVGVDEGVMRIELVGNANGEILNCVYNSISSPTGTFLNNALNKADLSSAYAGNATTGSLKYRICHRLVVMGESLARCGKAITGTCSGTVP